MYSAYYELDGVFFARRKKHDCPFCGEAMIIKVYIKHLHIDTNESALFQVKARVDGSTPWGWTDFQWEELYCVRCGKSFDIRMIREYERQSIEKANSGNRIISPSDCESMRCKVEGVNEKKTIIPRGLFKILGRKKCVSLCANTSQSGKDKA